MNKFLILFTLTICNTATAQHIHVAIATKSPLKVEAVKQTFQEAFKNDTLTFTSYPSTSHVPEQPIGKEVGLEGTRNRLLSIPADVAQSADYLVAIENFVEYSEQDGWYDQGLILVECRNTIQEITQTVGLTSRVGIPDHFVESAQQLSGADGVSEKGYTVTVGVAIAQMLRLQGRTPVDPTDWHKEKEFGGVSRKDLLQEALSKALNETLLAH